MTLKSLTYSEFEDDPRHWSIEHTEFEDINLMVGRNSTGKTRILNVIFSICRIISGVHTKAFNSGNFFIEVELDEKLYSYEISFQKAKVIQESLLVDGVERLSRDAVGEGLVYFASEDRSIPFQIDPEVIAIQNKNDRLQHPFINDLAQWASSVGLYNFGSDFGKSRLMQQPTADLTGSVGLVAIINADNTVGAYINGYQRFNQEFDKAIIRDMGKLGYHLEEVAAEPLDQLGLGLPASLLGLITVERDLGLLRNPQMGMSQGMFRAMALIIHINLAIFSKEQKLLLIDDIGEGLDYERATEIIDLIIAAAEQEHIQVLMTSNDRFVMNRVPLNYWVVLQRTGHNVKAFTARNSPKEFEDFKFIGLSNFDFFKDSRFH